MTETFAIH